MTYTPWVIDSRDKDSSEPKSILGDYFSKDRAEYELQSYLEYAKTHGMIIVSYGIDIKE